MFPIDLQYRVVGRFIKDAAPQKIKVLNTFNELDEYNSEGVVEFTMLGQTLRLRPFTTRPKRFYFVFRDASSGEETYEAARFLYADLLDDGTTVLDFNQAYNPPCAFNPYTTCPSPFVRTGCRSRSSRARRPIPSMCLSAASRRAHLFAPGHEPDDAEIDERHAGPDQNPDKDGKEDVAGERVADAKVGRHCTAEVAREQNRAKY